MSAYKTTVRWRREGDFLAGGYSRAHEIVFDGLSVKGSASGHIVAAPWSQEDAVDPEEMFVASLSACHMLWFLDLARAAGVEVEAYEDEAQGELARDEDGRMAMTEVVLRPKVRASAAAEVLEGLHHKAHERCFIANSVRTQVRVEAR